LLLRAKYLFVAASTVWSAVITRRARLGRLGNHLKCRSCQDRVFRSLAGGCAGSCVGRLRAASFWDSREACYFFPRGGGQADQCPCGRMCRETTSAAQHCFSGSARLGRQSELSGCQVAVRAPDIFRCCRSANWSRWPIPPVSFGLGGRGQCVSAS
jgi:hypothetical protein